jgi:uncharacterized protein YbjT (DUF2867 family)
MTPVVTVTGATSPVGTAVTTHLLQHRIHVRAVARRAAHLAPLVARGAEAHIGSSDDMPFLATACRGADAVFASLPGSPPSVPDYRADQTRLTNHIVVGMSLSKQEDNDR